jgi:hypothetical protein
VLRRVGWRFDLARPPVASGELRADGPPNVRISVARGGSTELRVGHAADGGAALGTEGSERFLAAVSALPPRAAEGFPTAGAHVDLDRRLLLVWCAGVRSGTDEQLRARWPGWQVEHLGDRFEDHFARIPGAVVPDPDEQRGVVVALVRQALAQVPGLARRVVDPELRPARGPHRSRAALLVVRWPDGTVSAGAFDPVALPLLVAVGENLVPDHLGEPLGDDPVACDGALFLDRRDRAAWFWTAREPLASDPALRGHAVRFCRVGYSVDIRGPTWSPSGPDELRRLGLPVTTGGVSPVGAPSAVVADLREHYQRFVTIVRDGLRDLPGLTPLVDALYPPLPTDDELLRRAADLLRDGFVGDDFRCGMLTATCPPTPGGARDWARLFTERTRADFLRWLGPRLGARVFDRQLFPWDDFADTAARAYAALASDGIPGR